MLEALRTTLKAIQALHNQNKAMLTQALNRIQTILNQCVKKVNGVVPDADGNVKLEIQVGWQEVTDKPAISSGGGSESIKEGRNTKAEEECSHAEGENTWAHGKCSHAEGRTTEAGGNYSHAEGRYTVAGFTSAHAEGESTYAGGEYSHAEGYGARATDEASHAEGLYTKADGKCQHVQGKYNVADTEDKYAHIVGNGEGSTARSNAHTLDWDGNAWFAGEVYVGSTSGTNRDEGSKKLATEEYVQELLLVDETEVV